MKLYTLSSWCDYVWLVAMIISTSSPFMQYVLQLFTFIINTSPMVGACSTQNLIWDYWYSSCCDCIHISTESFFGTHIAKHSWHYHHIPAACEVTYPKHHSWNNCDTECERQRKIAILKWVIQHNTGTNAKFNYSTIIVENITYVVFQHNIRVSIK